VHSVTVTPANIADIDELPKLLRADDHMIFADAGYTSDTYKRGARMLGINWCVQNKRKAKNRSQVDMLMGLANIYMLRRKLAV